MQTVVKSCDQYAFPSPAGHADTAYNFHTNTQQERSDTIQKCDKEYLDLHLFHANREYKHLKSDSNANVQDKKDSFEQVSFYHDNKLQSENAPLLVTERVVFQNKFQPFAYFQF